MKSRLTKIKEVGKNKWQQKLYLYKCSCGNEKIICGAYVNNGGTKSCGCLAREMAIKRNTTHGFFGKRIYVIYHGIKKRCEKKDSTGYNNYGGRGIKLKWKSFEEFRDDMLKSYNEHCKKFGEKYTTIDRIDNDGNYCKENCKWSTYKEQNKNRRQPLEWRNQYSLPKK